jgi:hypothetical protein
MITVKFHCRQNINPKSESKLLRSEHIPVQKLQNVEN